MSEIVDIEQEAKVDPFRLVAGYETKDLSHQMAILHSFFPYIGSVNEALPAVPRPCCTNGWVAVPKWQLVADSYSGAVGGVFEAISTVIGGRFRNHLGDLNSRLRQHHAATRFFRRLAVAQHGHHKTLALPVQFGSRHSGHSISEARESCRRDECCLDAFSVGVVVLTNLECFLDLNGLIVDCGGSEFDDRASMIRFGKAPYFRFSGGRIFFGARTISRGYQGFGSASGFLT